MSYQRILRAENISNIVSLVGLYAQLIIIGSLMFTRQTCHILGMAICVFDLKFCKNLYQSGSDNLYTGLPRIP